MQPSGPLNGIRVIDLSRVLAGPYCTMTLLDLGALVTKVETPAGGDDSRAFGPFIGDRSGYFMSLNRGKRSIALDLKAPDDKKIFEQLLRNADVLVENYRAGTMEKLGYGWDALKTRFPRLIYAATSGFGHTGPYSDRPAYDMVVQGMGGIMSLTGYPGGPPTRVGSSIGDITAGLFTSIGILSALHDRTATGRGQKVDVSMLDCQLAILENAIVRYFTTGEIPGPLGARHPSITPFEAYAAQDGYVIIAAGNDKLFHFALEALELPELVHDPRFTTGPLRNKNVEALKLCFEAALGRAPVAHWLAQLHERGVPAGPINNVAQILADPQIKVRNMVVTAQDPVAGTLHMAGNPIKLSAFSDPSTRGAPPELDGDRIEIIRELNEAQLHLARTKADDVEFNHDYMGRRYGSARIPGPRGLRDISALNGFTARNSQGLSGLASFELDADTAYLLWLDSAYPGRGCGGLLLQAVIDLARSEGCRKFCALVGNNNLAAAGFLQKRGFSISGFRPAQLEEYRAENSDFIPPGEAAIPARDFLELELSL